MQPARTTRSDRLLFAAVEACFLAYALLFIYRTSFVVAGRRYFSLFDDAMVSMRYARNVAQFTRKRTVNVSGCETDAITPAPSPA